MLDKNWLFIVLCITVLFYSYSCKLFSTSDQRFIVHTPDDSNIEFSNDISYTNEMNPYTYRSYFNGGGVGLGDFNNDGFVDIYLTGNRSDNKLYLKNGDFTFRDATQKAGVASKGSWSTGVSVVDINGDGLLDIYVCKSGSPGGPNRENELFINQGDTTFSEEAEEYGLDIQSLCTHTAFFEMVIWICIY